MSAARPSRPTSESSIASIAPNTPSDGSIAGVRPNLAHPGPHLDPCILLLSRSAKDTVEIGRRLGQLLRPGDLVVLSGTLGAGKTTLTQGIAAGLGVVDYVTSPTFTLVNEYRSAQSGAHPPLYHIDLYRTSGAAEALDLGLDEYLGEPGIAVIEWAEQAPEALPADYLLVKLEMAGDERRIEVCSSSPRYTGRLLALGEALGAYAAGD